MENHKNTTHCDSCKAELNGFWSSAYDEDGNLSSVLCRKCDKEKTKAEYEKTGILTTRYVTDMTLDAISKDKWKDPPMPFYDEIKYFEKHSWFNGIQSTVQKSSTKGMKAEAKGLTMLTYTIAGRAMITLEEDNASITLITAEDEMESRMGLQGICATEKQAKNILLKANMLWRNREDNGFFLKEDRKVSMAGF